MTIDMGTQDRGALPDSARREGSHAGLLYLSACGPLDADTGRIGQNVEVFFDQRRTTWQRMCKMLKRSNVLKGYFSLAAIVCCAASALDTARAGGNSWIEGVR